MHVAEIVKRGVTTKKVKKALVVHPQTGEEITLEEALERGVIDQDTFDQYAAEGYVDGADGQVTYDSQLIETSIIVRDPRTGEEVPLEEAVEKGLITPEDAKELAQGQMPQTPTDQEPDTRGQRPIRRISEPRFSVTIGRAKSIEAEEGKPIILQKVRRRVVKPKDAVERNLIDEETVDVLDNPDSFKDDRGKPCTLLDAIKFGKVDATKGSIKDPLKGEDLTIEEAVERGVIDIYRGNLLIPVARCLTFPDVMDQGLFNPRTQRIIHPETGAELTIEEALICEILDPLSRVLGATEKPITLQEAIERGFINPETNEILTKDRPKTISEAHSEGYFDWSTYAKNDDLPPLGITFPVAVERGYIEPKKKELLNNVTKEMVPLEVAIDEDMLMVLPFPLSPDAVDLMDALDQDLIDVKKKTFRHPKNNEVMPIGKAVENGLIRIKPVSPDDELMAPCDGITETLTQYHTITTRTIQLTAGHILHGPDQVKNLKTGKIISIDEARERGIVKDDDETVEEYTTREIKMSFTEAVKKGLICFKTKTYTDPRTGEKIPLTDAIEKGILRPTDILEPNEQFKTPMDLVQAGLTIYDKKNKRFKDPKSGRPLTLKDTTEKKIIDKHSFVVEVNTGTTYTVVDGMDKRKIDPVTGDVTNPRTGRKTPLDEAIKQGLIASIDIKFAKGQSLVDFAKKAVKKREEKPKDESPVPSKEEQDSRSPDRGTPRKPGKYAPLPRKVQITIEEAICADEIEPERCTLVVPKTGKRIPVRDIISKKIMSLKSVVEVTSRTEIILIEEVSMIISSTRKESPRKPLLDDEPGRRVPSSDKPEKKSPTKETPSKKRPEDAEPSEKPSVERNGGYYPKDEHSPVSPLKEEPRRKYPGKDEPVRKYPKDETPQKGVKEETKPFRKTSKPDEPSRKAPTDEVPVHGTRKPGKYSQLPKKPRMTIEEAICSDEIEPKRCTLVVPNTGKRIPVDDIVSKKIMSLQSVIEIVSRIEVILIEEKSVVVSSRRPKEAPTRKPSTKEEPSHKYPTKDEPHRKSPGKEEPSRKSPIKEDLTRRSPTKEEPSGRSPIRDEPSRSSPTKEEPTRKPHIKEEPLRKSPSKDEPSRRHPTKDEPSRSTPSRDRPYRRQPSDEESPRRRSPRDEPSRPRAPKSAEPSEPGKRSPTKTSRLTHEVEPVKEPEKFVTVKQVKYTQLPKRPKVTLQEAIDTDQIEPNRCVLIIPATDKRIPVRDIVTKKTMSLESVVMVMSRTEVVLVEEVSTIVRRLMRPVSAVEAGIYEPDSGCFMNPETQEPVSFKSLVTLGIMPAEAVRVLDLQTNRFMPVDEAIEQQIVDAETGDVYDTETRETVSFFRAVKEGLVKPEEEKPTKIPLSRVVDKGWYKPKRGTVDIPGYDRPIPLDEAFRNGVVSLDTVLVIDKHANEYVPAMQAEENGLIDLLDGTVKDTDRDRDIPVSEALNKGLIIPRRVPMSLEAVIRRQLYHPGTGRIVVPGTDEPVKLDEAIRRLLIDSESSQIKDTQKNESVTLERAITTRLVDLTTGQVTDTRSGHNKPLDAAYREGMIWTKPMPVDLTDAVQMGLYEPDTGKIIDPASGEDVTLRQAVELKIISVESIIVVDVETKVLHTYDRAVRAGLVDTERGVLRQPDRDVPLDRAIDEGMLAERKPPLALQEFVEKELYERATGHLIIFRTKERVTIEEAIIRTEINAFAETMKHPDTNEVLNLFETIDRGFLDPVSGTVTDPRSGEEVNLAEAMEHEVLLPAPKRIPLREVFEKNMYDSRTGRVSDPDTHETFTVERAIKIRLVDVSCTIVRDERKSRVLSFTRAVREGLVNGTSGLYCPDKTRRVPLNEAFKEGLISDVELPMSVKDAIQKGVYDEDTGLFFDPTTGDWLTLLEAVEERGILDDKSVLVRDTIRGFWKNVDLLEAMRRRLVEPDTARVKNFETHSDYSLQEAFEVGLVVDSQYSLSLQQAIKDGMYDEETGRFTDPVSGWKVSLHDIIKRFIVNPGLPCYFDTEEERLLNLNETCRAGIIDRRRGTFRHPKTGYDISLSEALRKGFIIDFEKPMSLYNLVHMGFYDPQTGKIVQPRTGRKLTLEDAVKHHLLDAKRSPVKHAKTGRFHSFPDAARDELVDAKNGWYVVPTTREKITMIEAKKLRYIVPSERPLRIIDAIKYQLCHLDSGKFSDPNTGDNLDLHDGIQRGLLCGKTTKFNDTVQGKHKRLLTAIKEGNIQTGKGRVIDTFTKRAYNYSVAFDRELLVSEDAAPEEAVNVEHIMKQEATMAYSARPADRENLVNYSLEEAIKELIINPETAVVLDPTTKELRPLKQALTDGLIEPKHRAMIDISPGRLAPQMILFEGRTVLYLRRPVAFQEAIDNGSLNVKHARYIEPSSRQAVTLKKAFELGLLDPNTVLMKDTKRARLIRLPAAFEQGLIEEDKGMVLDTTTGHFLTLEQAVKEGVIVTPRYCFSVLEALDSDLYDLDRERFVDPFTGRAIPLSEAIERGLIDPTTVLVRDPLTDRLHHLLAAIEEGLVTPNAGDVRQVDHFINIVEAHRLGLLVPAETRVRGARGPPPPPPLRLLTSDHSATPG